MEHNSKKRMLSESPRVDILVDQHPHQSIESPVASPKPGGEGGLSKKFAEEERRRRKSREQDEDKETSTSSFDIEENQPGRRHSLNERGHATSSQEKFADGPKPVCQANGAGDSPVLASVRAQLDACQGDVRHHNERRPEGLLFGFEYELQSPGQTGAQ
mmetsp:Transcript_8242/g.15292  ORF Transcript_8242/g.15292 Transcript_8242/m.15292 type:complete len:159 (-) Transcript_8242:154-630(-)